MTRDNATPRQWGLIVLLGLLTASGPLLIDMYLPSLPAIASELGASSAAVQQSVSAFFLGLAAGTIGVRPVVRPLRTAPGTAARF